MVPHDVESELRDLPERELRKLGAFQGSTIGLVRFSGPTHWERHPGQELLHILEGAVEICTRAADGLGAVRLRAGSVFIVPEGLWHHVVGTPSAALLFITPTEGNEHAEEMPD
jgi:quercetin dioxygenase-like cupin family protein